MPKKQVSYNELNEELNAIIQWFESADFDIDEAVKQYEKGEKLIKQMEDHLKTAENKIKKLNTTFDKG